MNRKTLRSIKRKTTMRKRGGGNGNGKTLSKRNQGIVNSARNAVERNAKIAEIMERRRQANLEAIKKANANERKQVAMMEQLEQQVQAQRNLIPGMTTGKLENFVKGNPVLTTVYNGIVQSKKPYITPSFEEHMEKYRNGM